ncbi:hypothetical protein [Escherichia coli]|uniref:hypothetical protein n=1 Tax=Escherichia coli TaxID=562 RepID=UPI0040698FB0
MDNYFAKNKDLLVKQKSEELEEVTRVQKLKLDKELSDLERLIANKKSEFEFEVKNVEAEKLKAKDEIEKIKNKLLKMRINIITKTTIIDRRKLNFRRKK